MRARLEQSDAGADVDEIELRSLDSGAVAIAELVASDESCRLRPLRLIDDAETGKAAKDGADGSADSPMRADNSGSES
jgi:hypothetical protein